mmetsp:Transcript_19521/g.26788  ORF Transcript_19521/g.26788 Transcript_19521/m.26788 type:complete len:326 (-) Transcript_19521:261-1238(-)
MRVPQSLVGLEKVFVHVLGPNGQEIEWLSQRTRMIAAVGFTQSTGGGVAIGPTPVRVVLPAWNAFQNRFGVPIQMLDAIFNLVGHACPGQIGAVGLGQIQSCFGSMWVVKIKGIVSQQRGKGFKRREATKVIRARSYHLTAGDAHKVVLGVQVGKNRYQLGKGVAEIGNVELVVWIQPCWFLCRCFGQNVKIGSVNVGGEGPEIRFVEVSLHKFGSGCAGFSDKTVAVIFVDRAQGGAPGLAHVQKGSMGVGRKGAVDNGNAHEGSKVFQQVGGQWTFIVWVRVIIFFCFEMFFVWNGYDWRYWCFSKCCCHVVCIVDSGQCQQG